MCWCTFLMRWYTFLHNGQQSLAEAENIYRIILDWVLVKCSYFLKPCCNYVFLVFSDLYQRKSNMNMIFTNKLFANTNSEWTLFLERSKNIKFGTKNVIFGYFMHILRLKFAKTVFMFQFSTLIFIKIQSSCKKKKLKFETKKYYLGICGQ